MQLIDQAGAMELLAMVAAMHGGDPSDAQAAMWAEVLSDIRFGDAREALLDHYRESPHLVTPADICGRGEAWREEWWRQWEHLGAYNDAAPIGMVWPQGRIHVEPLDAPARREVGQ